MFVLASPPRRRLWSRSSIFLNRGVSSLTAKRSHPEMAPQRLEKIESAPANGMGSETSNPLDLVRGRAADRARLLSDDPRMTKLQKKAPNVLKSLDAKLKSAPRAPPFSPCAPCGRRWPHSPSKDGHSSNPQWGRMRRRRRKSPAG